MISSPTGRAPSSGLNRKTKGLAATFAVAGIGHFVTPKLFEAIVPRWVPKPRGAVYASGVIELACAAGLITQAGWAGPLSAALLVAVWPANVQMAIDERRAGKPLVRQFALWARVPMQVPMIKTALGAHRT
ncbi:MAG: DoxX family protein [Acidimicrobiales bacterium]